MFKISSWLFARFSTAQYCKWHIRPGYVALIGIHDNKMFLVTTVMYKNTIVCLKKKINIISFFLLQHCEFFLIANLPKYRDNIALWCLDIGYVLFILFLLGHIFVFFSIAFSAMIFCNTFVFLSIFLLFIILYIFVCFAYRYIFLSNTFAISTKLYFWCNIFQIFSIICLKLIFFFNSLPLDL